MNKLYQHAQITINKVAIKPRISPRNNIKNFLEENDFKKTQPQYTNYYSLSASPSPPMSLSTSPSPNVKSSGDSPNTYASYETYLIDKLIDHQHYIEKLNKKLTSKQENLTLILTKLSELKN